MLLPKGPSSGHEIDEFAGNHDHSSWGLALQPPVGDLAGKGHLLQGGKLDYPGRVLRYMQDPELHTMIYGRIKPVITPLI